MRSLTPQQKDVRVGMIAGAVFCVVWVWTGHAFMDIDLPLWVTTGDRMAYVAKCEIFAALPLLLGVMVVAGQRFFSDQAIEGQTEGLADAITINLRYIQNSLEQLVLLVMTHMAYAATAGSGDMKIIPILVSLFIVGRVCFWLGYHQSPLSRAFGFAVTFYPSVVMMGLTLWRIGGGL